MEQTFQKWLMGLIGLGALYLVVTKPRGVYKVAKALENITGGLVSVIVSPGRR